MSFFQINQPRVISELIDGEVIILNFDKGVYYSLNESGILVWQAIQNKYTPSMILTTLTNYYHGANTKEVESDLEELLATLQEEELIVLSEQAESTMPLAYTTTDTQYKKPFLEKFTDLQDLLLLDPIHDTDEMGWPHQAK